jgi:cysteine desulfurase
MPAPAAYLDHAATTPVALEVLAAMQPYFAAEYGNPSSIHALGQRGEAAVEWARAEVAAVLGCPAQEVIFTSGGSESDNLALRGTAFASRERRRASRVLTTPVEHPAVQRTAEALARHHGFSLELLPVDSLGQVDPDDLRRRLTPDTALVSVIHANNEIGTLNPVADLARLCAEREIPFHTDAVQAAAHLDLHELTQGPALISIGGHKLYGPKGIGVLRRPPQVALLPEITGGGQEHGLRAGTHNVPLIIGMATALKLAALSRPADHARHSGLRDRILAGVPAQIPQAIITGHPVQRLPNHASFCIHRLDGNALIAALDRNGFACSSGSACKTGDPTPSGVLLALGLDPQWALGSLRVTVGRGTLPGEIDEFLNVLPRVIQDLRAAGAN